MSSLYKTKKKIECKWFIDNPLPINLMHKNDENEDIMMPTYEVYNNV